MELRERLRERNVDVCHIQETNLNPHMPTPKVSGDKAVMKADRRGGGLITCIKETLVFEAGPQSSTQGTKITTIHIRMNKNSWLSQMFTFHHITA